MGHRSMMMHKPVIGGVLVGIFVCLMASMAFAATLSGEIQVIRINSGTPPTPRVSILLVGTTACANSGWFAYESASSGLGSVQTAGLLAAYQSGRPVTIYGTGTCDAFEVEEISDIDLQ